MNPFRRRRTPTREEIRSAVPVRAPHVSQEANVLAVPLSEKKGALAWVARKSGAPTTVDIELDEIGIFVWELIDGKRSLAGIANALSKQYKLTKAEAEASLLEFVDSLRRRGCVYLKKG